MNLVFHGIGGLAGLAALVCFILVVIAMLQHNQTGLGIVCIVLIFCLGIGGLIAFIFGWMKSSEWQLKNIMIIWTIAIVIAALASGTASVLP